MFKNPMRCLGLTDASKMAPAPSGPQRLFWGALPPAPDRARRRGNASWLPSPKMDPRASSPRGHLEQGPPGGKGKAAAISPCLPRAPHAEEEAATIFPLAPPEGEAAILEEGRGRHFGSGRGAAILEAGASPLRLSRPAGPELTGFHPNSNVSRKYFLPKANFTRDSEENLKKSSEIVALYPPSASGFSCSKRDAPGRACKSGEGLLRGCREVLGYFSLNSGSSS